MPKTKITCADVADYFIYLSNQTGETITNLKLQKLVYYAQAWHLANYNKKLFGENFQAWIHGPVIPELYSEYKKFGHLAIQKEIDFKKLSKKINKKTLTYLNEVARVYMPCGAYQLEMMTHKEDPWVNARKGCASDEKCTNVISTTEIKSYYGNKIKV